MINPLVERKELAAVPWSNGRLLCRAFRVCSLFSTCASCSPQEADVLCDACIPRSARPPCCASAIPLSRGLTFFPFCGGCPHKPKVKVPNKDPARP